MYVMDEVRTFDDDIPQLPSNQGPNLNVRHCQPFQMFGTCLNALSRLLLGRCDVDRCGDYVGTSPYGRAKQKQAKRKSRVYDGCQRFHFLTSEGTIWELFW